MTAFIRNKPYSLMSKQFLLELAISLFKVGSAHVCLSNTIPGWKAFLTMLSDEIPLSKSFVLG